MLEHGIKKHTITTVQHLKKIEMYSNCVKFSSEKDDIGLHPTQKPLKLMKFLVELVVPAKGVVLDPFCGSGTTCLAAKLLERKYIGIEIDREMASIAQKRLDSVPDSLFA